MARFRSNPDVLTRKVGDELVLVHMGRSEVFALNRTGARLWELLTDGRSPSEAVEQLASEFNESEASVATEVDRMLAVIEEAGLGELARDDPL